MANEDRRPVDVWRRSFTTHVDAVGQPEHGMLSPSQTGKRDRRIFHPQPRRLIGCHGSARARDLDRAAGLCLEPYRRSVFGVRRVMPVIAMSAVLDLPLTVALRHGHAAHRLADVQRDPGRTGRDHQNGHQHCEDRFPHEPQHNSTFAAR